MSVRSSLIALAIVLAFPLTAAAQTDPGQPAPMPAQAQPAHPHHHHRPRYVAALRTLALTPDQKAQIRGFRRSDAKMFRDQVEGILTPDQRAQLRASLAPQQGAPVPQ